MRFLRGWMLEVSSMLRFVKLPTPQIWWVVLSRIREGVRAHVCVIDGLYRDGGSEKTANVLVDFRRMSPLLEQQSRSVRPLSFALEDSAESSRRHVERETLRSRRQAVDERRQNLSTASDHLSDLRSAASAHLAIQFSDASQHLEVQHSLRRRRASLISSLSSIYPIEPVPSTSDSLLFSINSLPLPNSLFIYPKVDSSGHSTALGWTAALTSLMANYLAVPLHYPITVVGSRSFVEDPVSMIRGPRAFPLYAKGVDRYRFDYGVFLLNKDIEQVRSTRCR